MKRSTSQRNVFQTIDVSLIPVLTIRSRGSHPRQPGCTRRELESSHRCRRAFRPAGLAVPYMGRLKPLANNLPGVPYMLRAIPYR
jgi:hypothetical protein